MFLFPRKTKRRRLFLLRNSPQLRVDIMKDKKDLFPQMFVCAFFLDPLKRRKSFDQNEDAKKLNE